MHRLRCSGIFYLLTDLFSACSVWLSYNAVARLHGVVIAGWTVDKNFRHILTVRGPSDDKEVKDVFARPGAHFGVGSAR